jgi:protein-disulfide isomerase
MNKRAIVIATALVAIIGFGVAGYFYSQSVREENYAATPLPDGGTTLIRPNSPVMGPAQARVTIVEFIDPACESCRAFYPVVKQIMAEHGKNVRLVLRYAPLHDGSEEAVRILETARLQGKFQPVLEALLDAQPVWASHGNPNMAKAWEAARKAGLDEERARREMNLPGIDAIIRQDVADLKAVNLRGTPTFYVNGKPLPSFGRQQLENMVRSEVVASN